MDGLMKSAIRQWNRREAATALDSLQAEVERLKDCITCLQSASKLYAGELSYVASDADALVQRAAELGVKP